MKKKLGLVTLSCAMLTSVIAPNITNAEKIQPEQSIREQAEIFDGINIVDESNILEQLIAEETATSRTPTFSRVVVNDGYQDYTYDKTIYGDTTNRDGFVAAMATVIINGLPGGAVLSKVKTVWNTILIFLGFGNYSPEYLKAVVYTKNDPYYNRTKIVYYKYSDSSRTKLINQTTRFHEVPIKDYR